MQELARAMNKASCEVIEGDQMSGGSDDLRSAAKTWSVHCLDALSGELLRKGLEVSRAIAEFLNEMDPKP